MKYYDKARKGEETSMAGFSFQVGGKLNGFLSFLSIVLGISVAIGALYLALSFIQ